MIKTHKNKNQYFYSDKIYIRDFTETTRLPHDINNLSKPSDYDLFVDNECENFAAKYPQIDSENIFHPNIVIVSDGHSFKEKQKILADLDKDKIKIIGVNGSLNKWQLVGEQAEYKRAMNYYVVNNPYEECCYFLPQRHRYYPKCIASSRTNPSFLKRYLGNKYIYTPVEDKMYAGIQRQVGYKIDDYRNPICAAISLAFRFGVQKLLLFCCDDSFSDERPGAEKLENNLWCYPQQNISHSMIDGMLYWLKTKKIEVADHSSGRKFKHATYIKSEDSILRYFEND